MRSSWKKSVDETKDLSKTEQLAFVIRYTYECNVHEEFIGFRATEDLNAESLSRTIQDELKQIGINIKNLVAQGYDGAAVISGKCSGVQQRKKRSCRKQSMCTALLIV